MSILKAALSRENVERQHKAAVQLDRKAEHSAVVAAIHKAFVPEVPELETLALVGDYRRPVALADAQPAVYTRSRVSEYGCKYCSTHGLELHLGSKISPEVLRLTVWERTDTSPLKVELNISRSHPFKSEVIQTFHGHTEPSEMLERFFEVLGKRIADVTVA
jgi:hypothetical protein